MKKILLLFVLVSTATAFGQKIQKKSATIKENKYRINLPDYWGKGNKVWKILIDKLPQICEELADKEVCGDDCNPKYSVDFYMTSPVIIDYFIQKKHPPLNTNTRIADPARRPLQNTEYANSQVYNNLWQVTSYYNFECYLLLRDENGKIITKMVLVDTNEVFQKKQDVGLSSYNEFKERVSSGYIDNHKEKFLPTDIELIAIADKKMLAL